jgi:hypothetical protein
MISAGFAVAALASASVPALAWTVWPDVDFEWYADVGRAAPPPAEYFPPARPGYIWSPGHYERVGSSQQWVGGQWVRDDFYDQVAYYRQRNAERALAAAPMTIYDQSGNPIPTSPDAYPIGSATSPTLPATAGSIESDSSRR